MPALRSGLAGLLPRLWFSPVRGILFIGLVASDLSLMGVDCSCAGRSFGALFQFDFFYKQGVPAGTFLQQRTVDRGQRPQRLRERFVSA